MTRRSLDKNHSTSSTSGIFKPVCLFCNQAKKSSGGKTIPLLNATSKEIEGQKVCRMENDQEMLTKVTRFFIRNLCGGVEAEVPYFLKSLSLTVPYWYFLSCF